MSECLHKNLVLLKESPKEMVRCTRCHLVIGREELSGGYCPECYEAEGTRHTEFEPAESPRSEKTRYRCERCGAMVECE